MIITTFEAIRSLLPEASFGYKDGVITWMDNTFAQPTDAEIESEIIRLQAEVDAKQYQRTRATQYPQIADQLDMLWHAIDTGTVDKTSDFYTTLKAVKDAIPKA